MIPLYFWQAAIVTGGPAFLKVFLCMRFSGTQKTARGVILIRRR